ncbi:N-acyl homoserine lactonase family protein [Natrarchaeobaculum sulfurireducens]|uniref:Metallo-beta-lactamase domain-containing protein n=1 Tax=Natrarchaeobaculum sulfurireducens TaxID=2044521 RepID=A0A346PNZ4_9EURY|nr:N-acyl homoserine lactonase family protein [Natrarchaeobaculum sulfurireducens]AXR81239.1 hypothetical protein AArcMg_1223 [Natrarchaeobaculum sulfurireducens]
MKIHALSVGRLSLPNRHVSARRRTLPGRYLDVWCDDSQLEPAPIFCFAIEHPEGVIVVDVGETTDVFEPRAVDLGARVLVDRDGLDLEPADELASQLEAVGIDPGEVSTVILTHLHFDHAGAVGAFPNADVLVSRREFLAHRLLPLGSSVHRWPDDLEPMRLTYDGGPFGPFESSHRLTDAGDVLVVPTPGHTPGHQSVLVREEEALLCLAGDVTFTESQLLEDDVVGIALDGRTSRQSARKIRRLLERERVVYLPAHDPETKRRLEERVPTTIDASD